MSDALPPSTETLSPPASTPRRWFKLTILAIVTQVLALVLATVAILNDGQFAGLMAITLVTSQAILGSASFIWGQSHLGLRFFYLSFSWITIGYLAYEWDSRPNFFLDTCFPTVVLAWTVAGLVRVFGWRASNDANSIVCPRPHFSIRQWLWCTAIIPFLWFLIRAGLEYVFGSLMLYVSPIFFIGIIPLLLITTGMLMASLLVGRDLWLSMLPCTIGVIWLIQFLPGPGRVGFTVSLVDYLLEILSTGLIVILSVLPFRLAGYRLHRVACS